MTIDLIFITFNRLEYTKLALPALLADPKEEFRLTIWDNASTDGTVEYLKNEVKDPRIVDIVFSNNNIGQFPAVNEVWGKSKADLLGKVDNDCLVTPGWTRTLAQAHADIPELGIVACWHYFPEDFDYERAKHKIQTFGRHQIFRHPWPDGTGLLFKRNIFERLGPIQKHMSKYWIKVASAGYINGYYFPLIYVEHMDDIRSKHSRFNRMSFDEAFKYRPAYQHDGRATNRKQLEWNRVKYLENLLTDPYDPKYYIGWRSIPRRARAKILRILKKSFF